MFFSVLNSKDGDGGARHFYFKILTKKGKENSKLLMNFNSELNWLKQKLFQEI